MLKKAKLKEEGRDEEEEEDDEVTSLLAILKRTNWQIV